MVNKILFALLCLGTFIGTAQNGTVSPYSYYGLGDFRSVHTVENNMMGGLGMYTDSIHLNFQNPASLGKLRLTVYSAAFSHKEVRLEDFNTKLNSSVTTLEYLALAFPISPKMGVGFGLKPFSSVGYDLVGESTAPSGATITNTYSGQDGLNQLYLSTGFQLFPQFHLGASVNYTFGELDHQRVQTIEDIQYGTLDRRISKINGFDFVYGATFTPKLNDKYTLFTSLVVNTQMNLNSENTQRIGSFLQSSGQEIQVGDINLATQGLDRTSLRIPTQTTFGLGIGEDKHWFLGAEYSMQSMSEFQNEFLDTSNVTYNDASVIALGGYYIPNYTSFSSLLSRITYRAGLRLDNTGLIVNNNEINNFGITFGLGIPLNNLGGDFSNLNVGFELGRRGTTADDLVRESYLKINIGLSFTDRWFRKRQIN